MAIVTRYVNTLSTPGGDGTTNETTGVNRAYATLTDWQNAEVTDLVAAGDSHVVHCSGTVAETGTVRIRNWTTGPSNTVTINGEGNNAGKYDETKYRIEVVATGNFFRCLRLDNTPHVKVNDLQCKYSAAGVYTAAGGVISDSNVDGIEINRCLVELNLTGGAVASDCAGIRTSKANNIVRSCIVYESGNKGEARGFRAIGYYDNCSAIGCDVGFLNNWSYLQNCLAQDCNTSYVDTPQSADYCCGDVGGGAVPGTNTVVGTVSFVDAAGHDYTPSSADTVVVGAGIDLSGTFNFDLAGNLFNAGAWEIGGLKVESGVVAPPGNPVMHGTNF